jgi:HAMP domain-containing protein
MNDPSEKHGWQIDKRIPVSLLGAILLQGVVWGGWVYSSQKSLENRVVLLERTTVTTDNYGRLDEKMNTVKDDIGSLKRDISEVRDEIRRMAVRGKP